MKKSVILKILIVIFIAVFVFSGYNVVKILLDTAATNNLYAELQSEYIKPSSESLEEESKEPLIEVDFPALLEKNDDIVGWLYLPGSVISYPVVQAENNKKYLRRDLSGKKLNAGTLFVDFRNGQTEADPNYVIYGHNMKNGTMFKTLISYKEQSFFNQNPVIYYLTPDKTYKIELVAGVIIPNDDPLYDVTKGREQMFETIKSHIKNSTFTSNVTVSQNDNFITLSTCSYEYENARYAVIGKLNEIE